MATRLDLAAERKATVAPRRWRAAVGKVLIYGGLTLLALIFVYPLFLMVITAFKSTREIFLDPFGLPSRWSLEPFITVWRRANFSTYFRNSVLVTAASTVLVLTCSSLAAYALGRYRFRLNNALYIFFLAGIMIPIRLGVLPLFLLMRNLNLLDTHWSLILTYAASGMPMSVFLLTGFFRTLPRELEYAARIDGCSEFQTFSRVMLPLV
ncbi:MAG: carbohydrate ABC transporter permease, partial [Bacillota bacterium]